MVKEVTFLGFREAISPIAPLGSTPLCTFLEEDDL